MPGRTASARAARAAGGASAAVLAAGAAAPAAGPRPPTWRQRAQRAQPAAPAGPAPVPRLAPRWLWPWPTQLRRDLKGTSALKTKRRGGMEAPRRRPLLELGPLLVAARPQLRPPPPPLLRRRGSQRCGAAADGRLRAMLRRPPRCTTLRGRRSARRSSCARRRVLQACSRRQTWPTRSLPGARPPSCRPRQRRCSSGGWSGGSASCRSRATRAPPPRQPSCSRQPRRRTCSCPRAPPALQPGRRRPTVAPAHWLRGASRQLLALLHPG